MVTTINILGQNIAPVESPNLLGLNNHCKVSPRISKQGLLLYLLPSLIISKQIRRDAIQQTILFSVSAGNDFEVSTMRPDDSIAVSKGVMSRYAKGKRGVHLLDCRVS
jgi:hypothetical protein